MRVPVNQKETNKQTTSYHTTNQFLCYFVSSILTSSEGSLCVNVLRKLSSLSSCYLFFASYLLSSHQPLFASLPRGESLSISKSWSTLGNNIVRRKWKSLKLLLQTQSGLVVAMKKTFELLLLLPKALQIR